MSALLMGRSMYVPLDMASRLVLVALADHANDDGTESRPGLRRIGVKTGLSRRATQQCLAHLEWHGLIKASGYRFGGHGRTTNWTIDPFLLRAFSDWFEDNPDDYEKQVERALQTHSLTVQQMHSLEEKGAGCHRKQCALEPLTVRDGSPQPSRTILNRADFQVETVEPLLPGESQWERARRIALDI